MAEVMHDKNIIDALSWYIKLDNKKIQKWKDLVDAFIKQQYGYCS
jgi:hypothetical protein